MTISTDAERRRQDNLNTASLVGLLSLMAVTTAGGVIVALVQQIDGQLRALIAFSGLLLAAGLIGLLVYVLVNPVYERPSRPATYASRRRTSGRTTTARWP